MVRRISLLVPAVIIIASSVMTTINIARRIWSDSQGGLWISEWNAGKLVMYNPTTNKKE